MIEIQHQSIANNWLNPDEINNPKTLILGSFNPFNPNTNQNTDYYYGRSTNHFWKSIARNLGQNEDYFCGHLERKIEVMNKHKFCFFDIINSLEIECKNEIILNEFIANKIHIGYADSTIFKRTSAYQGETILIKRNYNERILKLIERSNFKRIIHTMGNNRISENYVTNPLEINLGENGFQKFYNRIIKKGKEYYVHILPLSINPSAYGVNTGRININDLDNWINENVLL